MKRFQYKMIFHSLFSTCRREMAWYLFTMALLALTGPLSILLRGRILDAAISDGRELPWIMLCFGAVAVLSFLTAYGNSMGKLGMKRKLYGDFSEKILEKFSRIRYSVYESGQTFDTIKRAGDAPQEHILEFFSTLLEAAAELVAAVCYMAVFARLSLWCLLLGILSFGIMLFFDLRRIRLMMELYEEQTKEERLMESYGQALGNKNTLYDLRVAGAVPYLLKKRKKLSDSIVKERYRRTIQSQCVYAWGEMATVLWMAVVLLFAVNAFLRGRITLGLFVALAGSLRQMAGTFRTLGEKYSELQRRMAFVKYYMAFMELEEMWPIGAEMKDGLQNSSIPYSDDCMAGYRNCNTNEPEEYSLGSSRECVLSECISSEQAPFRHVRIRRKQMEHIWLGDIPPEYSQDENAQFKHAQFEHIPFAHLPYKRVPFEYVQFEHVQFEHVSFTYPGQTKPALRDVSFVMEAGNRIALVGHNGSGKSTLIKLLCGLYQPDSGRILINGQDIATLAPTVLRRFFSVIFQDYGRYFFTVQENVELGDVEKAYSAQKREEEVKAALHAGLAEDLVDRLGQELGNLSSEGVELSGGQWQRLALSRACYRDSEILVLDEPTASLDPVAENELYAGFTRIMHGRSCIFISHRLAVARHTDRILVLQDGALVEDGNHESLMERKGTYASMYQAQSKWYAKGKNML